MIRHGESSRLHHSGLGAVRADADPRADRRNLGAGLSRRTRSARARGRHPLSAHASGLPAGARCLPRRDRDERSNPAAHRRDRRRRRGRDRLRPGGDRRPCGRRARSANGDRRARAANAAGAARAQVGRQPCAGQERRSAARRQQSGVGARARRRSRPPDGRHDHTRGFVGSSRRARAGSARPLLAAHARIPEDRPRGLADHSC